MKKLTVLFLLLQSSRALSMYLNSGEIWLDIINESSELASTTHPSDGYWDVFPSPDHQAKRFYLRADDSQKITTPSGAIYGVKVVIPDRYAPQPRVELYKRQAVYNFKKWTILPKLVAEIVLTSYQQRVKVTISKDGDVSLSRN